MLYGHHHTAQTPGMGHGSAEHYLKRFWLVTALLIPLVLVHPKVSELIGMTFFDLNKWARFNIVMSLSTVIVVLNALTLRQTALA